MNGFCTFTVEVDVEGTPRDVFCSKPRVGSATAPGLSVVLCRRHWDQVERAMQRNKVAGMTLVRDVPPPVDWLAEAEYGTARLKAGGTRRQA